MTNPKIPSLDGLRALSIMLVLMSHTLKAQAMGKSQFEGIRSYATVGVIMFFVISGFLITSLLLNEKNRRERIDIRRFYMRRILRIIPVQLKLSRVSNNISSSTIQKDLTSHSNIEHLMKSITESRLKSQSEPIQKPEQPDYFRLKLSPETLT